MGEAALAVVLEKRDSRGILLVKRRDVAVWTLPGGGVEPGEAPEEAALREVEEETGVKAKVLEKAGLYSPVNRLSQTTHLYLCEALEGSPRPTSESRACGYFAAGSLPQPFFFLHADWIEDALSDHPKPLARPIDQISYLKLLYYLARHPIHMGRYLLSKIGLPIHS